MSFGKQLFSDPLSWKWMCVRSSVVLHASPIPFSNLLPTKAAALHRWADRGVSYLQLCLCDVYQLRPDVCVAPEQSADGAASLALLCCCSWIHIKERIRNLLWFTKIPGMSHSSCSRGWTTTENNWTSLMIIALITINLQNEWICLYLKITWVMFVPVFLSIIYKLL